jgi:hypothetical protein
MGIKSSIAQKTTVLEEGKLAPLVQLNAGTHELYWENARSKKKRRRDNLSAV